MTLTPTLTLTITDSSLSLFSFEQALCMCLHGRWNSAGGLGRAPPPPLSPSQAARWPAQPVVRVVRVVLLHGALVALQRRQRVRRGSVGVRGGATSGSAFIVVVRLGRGKLVAAGKRDAAVALLAGGRRPAQGGTRGGGAMYATRRASMRAAASAGVTPARDATWRR